MDVPLRTYFLSPLNPNLNNGVYFSLFLPHAHPGSELQNRDHYLNLLGVDVQSTRLPDILDAFWTASYEQSNPSLILLAESLRVRSLFLW